MLIIIGIRTIRRRVRGGLSIRRICGRCHVLSDLEEHRWTKFVTLFFIPVIPVSRGERVLTCSRCKSSFAMPVGGWTPAEEDPEPERASEERTVVACAVCGKRVRVPAITGKQMHVTCPHCDRSFDVTL